MSNKENTTFTSIAEPEKESGGNNEMAVRKYGDKYEVAVPDGRYANGRMKYRRELADTEEQAYKREKELLAEIKEIQNRLDLLQEKQEVKSGKPFRIAADKWIESKKDEVTLKTWKRYESILSIHAIPYFQDKPVNEISEEEIREYFQANPNCGTTLRQHYVILDNILRQEGLNTMQNIKRPKKNRRAIVCIKDPVELAEFVMGFKNSLLYLPVHIAANTGMRFSEVAGLRWQDVDLYNGYIHVSRSLHWEYDDDKNRYWYIQEEGKTINSLRTIKINSVDIEVLKEAKKNQRGKQGDFVCLDTMGNPIAQDIHGANFCQYAKAMGYNISFHSLRHSHATILIMIYKVPIKTVSVRLGHSDITVTLSIYTSVIQEQDDLAAVAMEDVFAEARKDTKHLQGNKENVTIKTP